MTGWLFSFLGALAEVRLSWPERIPHPVRLIGCLLDRMEVPARTSEHPRLAGCVCLLFALVCVGGSVQVLLAIPFLGAVAAGIVVFAGLALGELIRVCRRALSVLEEGERTGDITEARRQVGMLVSRDTTHMQAAELRRALAETLAENFNDAFVAPCFWLIVGGPVALWCYKTVSTMDSMWGYTTPEWKQLGMAGARCDDVLAWIPARLSALLLGLSALFSPHAGNWPGLGAIRRQARRMASPNAGWPMAAAAWLHHAPMGGPTPYFGRVLDKPRLGPDIDAPWSTPQLTALLTHVERAGLLLLFTALLLAVVSGFRLFPFAAF